MRWFIILLIAFSLLFAYLVAGDVDYTRNCKKVGGTTRRLGDGLACFKNGLLYEI